MFRPASSLATGMLALSLLAGSHDRTAVCEELPATVRAMRLDTRLLRLTPATAEAPPPIITALRLHPDGRMVVVAGDDHRVRLIELETGRTLRTLAGHSDWVGAAAFSPDGQFLVTAGQDHRVIGWPLSGSEEGWSIGPLPGAISQLEFNRRGDLVAIVGFGQPLELVEVKTGRRIETLQCPCRDMRCVAFSPDDHYLAGAGRNGKVRVWDAQTQEENSTFVAHHRRIRAIRFTEDGSQLLTASEDGTVRVSNVRDGSELYSLHGVPGKVLAMTVLPGKRLATASSDNVIRIWDLKGQRLVSQLKGHTGSVAALDANERYLVSGSYDATVRLWPIDTMEQAIVALEQRRIAEQAEEEAGDATQPTSLRTEIDP